MKQRNHIVQKFGWWIRFYSGSTANRRRLWRWRFEGIKGTNYGITLRLFEEECIGIQWRRSYSELTMVEKCPGCDLYLPTEDHAIQQYHMETNHPEIIKKRLESAGFIYVDGRLIDTWSSD